MQALKGQVPHQHQPPQHWADLGGCSGHTLSLLFLLAALHMSPSLDSQVKHGAPSALLTLLTAPGGNVVFRLYFSPFLKETHARHCQKHRIMQDQCPVCQSLAFWSLSHSLWACPAHHQWPRDGPSLGPFCVIIPALSASSLLICSLFSPMCPQFWWCWVLDPNLLFSLCKDKTKRGEIFGYFLTNGLLLSFVFQICICKAGFSGLLCFLPSFLCLEFLSCFCAGLESHLLTEIFRVRKNKTISNFFTLPLHQFLIFNSLDA